MAPRPFNLIAELSYRCPLRCPYCSNPLNYAEVRETLDAEAWGQVMREASAMGVVHVGLTGGEPTVRTDLDEIVAAAADAQLFTHLVTSGMPIDPDGLGRLARAGLRSVQLSFQDSLATESDRIAGTACFERKLAIARATRELGLPLVVNVVLHRHNLARVREIIALARQLDAERLELANTQYHGWALENREGLLPSREQLDTAAKIVREERGRPGPEILYVLPDYFSNRPKPCMGGWGRKNIVVAPDGTVLPCQAAASLPGLEFWRVSGERDLAACWSQAPGMNRYRGESWMPEPCRSCEQRGRDFGGCRCQAFHLTGDAGATDPACELSPHHDRVVAARTECDLDPPLRPRGSTGN
jgi:pyrroloquinoline quinone biosynthesis protein E